jgi:hypothetical protein
MNKGLTEKRLEKVLAKAQGRYAWYVGAYPHKARWEPAEASKRWWEAVARAVLQWDGVLVGDVIARVKDDEAVQKMMVPYIIRADRRWFLPDGLELLFTRAKREAEELRFFKAGLHGEGIEVPENMKSAYIRGQEARR